MLYCTKVLKPRDGESCGFITSSLGQARAYARSVKQYPCRVYTCSVDRAQLLEVGKRKTPEGDKPILAFSVPVVDLLLNESESKAV